MGAPALERRFWGRNTLKVDTTLPVGTDSNRPSFASEISSFGQTGQTMV